MPRRRYPGMYNHAGRTFFQPELISGEASWGKDTEFVLSIAAEKAILFSNVESKLRAELGVLPENLDSKCIDRVGTLQSEWLKQKAKMEDRAWSARLHADAGMIISLTDRENGQMIAEGRFSALNIGRASLTVVREGSDPQEVVYATSKPVPEHLGQSFCGMEMTVDIDVLAVPEHEAWIFSPDPNY